MKKIQKITEAFSFAKEFLSLATFKKYWRKLGQDKKAEKSPADRYEPSKPFYVTAFAVLGVVAVDAERGEYLYEDGCFKYSLFLISDQPEVKGKRQAWSEIGKIAIVPIEMASHEFFRKAIVDALMAIREEKAKL